MYRSLSKRIFTKCSVWVVKLTIFTKDFKHLDRVELVKCWQAFRQLHFDKVCQPLPSIIRMYVLKPVICEGRQLSVICHVEAVLEGFPN